MRKIVLLATCAGLAAVAPASAGDLVETGKASVTLGWTSLDESNDESSNETDDQSYGLFGLDASYSIPLAPDWSVQADVLAEKFMISGSAVKQRLQPHGWWPARNVSQAGAVRDRRLCWCGLW
jgi:hypothetical protein